MRGMVNGILVDHNLTKIKLTRMMESPVLLSHPRAGQCHPVTANQITGCQQSAVSPVGPVGLNIKFPPELKTETMPSQLPLFSPAFLSVGCRIYWGDWGTETQPIILSINPPPPFPPEISPHGPAKQGAFVSNSVTAVSESLHWSLSQSKRKCKAL